MNPRVTLAWKALRYSYAAVVFLAGLDKVIGTNIITQWPKYVSPFVASHLPISIGAFIVTIGIIEIVVAILALTRFTMLASYISVAWLLLISVNLMMIGGILDIAVRDILLAVGAYATALLSSAHGYTLTEAPARSHA